MRAFEEMTIEKRLIYAFLVVVLVCSVLSALVFTVFLVDNIKKSTKEKISETLKIVHGKTDELSRNLETYADLISSDINFGQVLSFDSSVGIQNKINELATQSHADAVVFIPKPMHYVQIKDEIFSNIDDSDLKKDVKSWVIGGEYLEKGQVKGWILLHGKPYLFAAKAVVYFGANMGVILLARQPTPEFVQDLSKAAGAGITLLGPDGKLVQASLDDPGQAARFPAEAGQREVELVEDVGIAGGTYTALVSPVTDYGGKAIGRMVLLSSNASIREAQRRTLYSALIAGTLTLILSTFLGFLLAGAVSRPIREVTQSIQQIADKADLSIRVPPQKGVEIGIMAGAFNKLLEQLQDTTRKLAESERRMKQELTMASTVQEMLFPPKKCDFAGVALASYIGTSSETGGDWFGYGADPDSGRVSVLIGDVTGHGMPAALITAITNGFFKGLSAEDSRDAGRLLGRLNDILIESTRKSLLMTFFASSFDPATKVLTYANAGHVRPLLCRRGDEGWDVSVLPSDPGRRLGEEAGVAYVRNEFQLSSGDIVVWYTDGIVDCGNPAGDAFGKRRLLKAVKDAAAEPVEMIVERIVAQFESFTAGEPKADDVTLVAAKIA